MFNFPFYNYNPLILDEELRKYIKNSNTKSFNNFIEQNKVKKLQPSLINYRNYSNTFLNDKTSTNHGLKNEDYLCDFCDLNDPNDPNDPNDDNDDDKKENNKNKGFLIFITRLIGGVSIIGGITILYYYTYSINK